MTDAPLTVLVSGASGLVGTELTRQLREAGHRVVALVRGEARDDDQVTWVPAAGIVDYTVLDRADAVVNLSGANLGRLPWTPGYKKEIVASRVSATQTLARGMARAETPPTVFLSGSAVGIYGDRPGERLTEESPRGTGFLSDVVAEWEASTAEAPSGTRVAHLRTGVVVGPGGALKPLLPLTRLGLGSRLGTGDQFWPWISLHDEAAAIVHLLTSTLEGPVNLAGPTPATSDELTRRLAGDLGKPYALTVPEFVISGAMQEAGREMLLPSQQVVPAKLLADGFAFRHRTVDEAVDALVSTL
ncbi:TIGR01777 family protein [Frigoribacterium sp. CFBP 8754]|uniref:TIGR01777 family oxidoreductase n=1 Tax=unclassified Frigoribacterium TaxID=2627005 RepID=UPI00178246A3|nr:MULTISPECIES: TIGR01777 family oxidoreductase [unclassified Frigoribacterium]MBD8659874.1 TIGR01777 family protein [Frigoribacterium sp. CFBP 8754]MBD8728605.1 TIGR01777 family protein [Frigoribacterium sp. CFBP 13707]